MRNSGPTKRGSLTQEWSSDVKDEILKCTGNQSLEAVVFSKHSRSKFKETLSKLLLNINPSLQNQETLVKTQQPQNLTGGENYSR